MLPHALGLAIASVCSTPATVRLDQAASRWMIWGFYGQSWFIFGSEDFRHSVGAAIQWVRPEKRFTFKKNRADLVLEVNYTRSTGGDKFEFDADTSNALGVLALGRYEFGRGGRVATYVEAGWGFQYADTLTIDLPSQFNSTPTLGAGVIFNAGRSEIYAGLRWIHISNAGTKGNNPGQNQIMLALGIKF